MASPKTTTSKKESASTELVLGQAAAQITKAVNELNSAVETVNKLALQAEDLTLKVANKETQIAELDTIFAEKSRQSEVEFDLNMKAHAERVVSTYLNASNKVAVPSSELSTLQKELSDTKAGAENETKRQVAIVSNSLKSQYENEIKLIHSENKSVAAENVSKIVALTEKTKFLEQQLDKAYHQLDAERAAGVERAKASSIGNITVGESGRK